MGLLILRQIGFVLVSLGSFTHGNTLTRAEEAGLALISQDIDAQVSHEDTGVASDAHSHLTRGKNDAREGKLCKCMVYTYKLY